MVSGPLETTPPASQADRAYEALRDMLIRLDIAPGAPISESGLMAQIGVGRTPFREAIHRLERERLVTIFPRRGTFASEINLADLALLTDLREELEGHAAARAAQWADLDERTELRELRRRLLPEELEAQMELDTAIHRAIYAATHNHFLEETATTYHNLSMRIWRLFTDRAPELADHITEHHNLLSAIIAGEVNEARQAAIKHVQGFAAAIRGLI